MRLIAGMKNGLIDRSSGRGPRGPRRCRADRTPSRRTSRPTCRHLRGLHRLVDGAQHGRVERARRAARLFGCSLSTASMYWIRSLVPIEKKSTSRMRWFASATAEGILDHHAHLRRRLEVAPLPTEPRPSPLPAALRLTSRSTLEIMGKHDAHAFEPGAAQDGAQLDFEELGHFQRDPNRPPAEESVVLARHLHVGPVFIRADVQGPDRDGTPLHAADDARRTALNCSCLRPGTRDRRGRGTRCGRGRPPRPRGYAPGACRR